MSRIRKRMVRLHPQAMDMAKNVREHLKAHPEDGILFLLDFEQALNDIGFALSNGMRAHLARQFPQTSDYRKECYRRIKAGERPPFEVVVQMKLDDEERGSVFKNASPESLPGSDITSAITSKPVHDLSASLTTPLSSGFSVLIQLSQSFINRALSAAYNANVFPHKWIGEVSVQWTALEVDVEAQYEINLAKPSLDFRTDFADGVRIDVAIDGFVVLDFDILQLLNPTHSEYREAVRLDFAASVQVVATAVVAPYQSDESAVYLNLKDLLDLRISINNAGLPADLLRFLEHLLLRIVETDFRGGRAIPLTFGFNHMERSGIPLVAVRTKILPPDGTNPGTLSICLDTTGQGNVSTIRHIIPTSSHYAMVLTRHFLLGQVWERVGKPKFPVHKDRATIYNPQLNMLEGRIWFRVEAEYEVDCLPDVNATGTIELRFQSFLDNGIYKTKMVPIGEPDISMSFWDRLFYSFLLGLLLTPLGLGEVGVIILNILISILEDKLESEIGQGVQSFNVGFYKKIPGTTIVVAASTPVEPEIHMDRIFAHGDAVFFSEP